MTKRWLLGATALALVSATAGRGAPPPPDAARAAVAPVSPKKVVRTQDDLPRHSYPVSGTARELLMADDATFNAWAARIAADTDATLATYDIQDRATLRGLLDNRVGYQILTGQNAAALATLREARALQDKPDAKLLGGLRDEAMLKARIATGAASGPDYERAFAATYAAALDGLPWAVVGNSLKEQRGNLQLMNRSLVEGYVLGEIEPIVAREHKVSDKPAADLLWARVTLKAALPLRESQLAAISRVVAAHTVAKPDIWAAREVTLTAADRATPVIAAVWDSGTDLALFPGQVYTDPNPARGGPYHAHGLAFDVDSRPDPVWLYPLTPAQQAEYRTMLADFQGLSDLQAAIDSPASTEFRAKLAAMPPADQPAYFEKLGLYGNYLHGTHVAGIMARGNPAIRLASARLTFDHRTIPTPPTDELMRRTAESYRTTVDWFRTHGVRVVNMSWGDTPASYETVLEKNGIGKDAAERKALARRYFDIGKAGLLAALRSAPDILFVCAAGNSNADNGFEEAIPSGYDLPNLLTVSAVDRGGDEAGFTSYGKNVVVSANGYQVDSLVPGGARLAESGTSMASPNVANLAAKLIALDPRLTPAETIRLIRAGATASADGRRHNIDPKASLALLRRR